MKKFIIVIFIVVLAVGGVYYWRFASPAMSDIASPAMSDLADFTQTYASPTYGFSFKYPTGFSIQEIPNAETGPAGETLIVQNAETHQGVQIAISAFEGEDVDITEDLIKSELPDLAMSDIAKIEIGANRKGLAFASDNQNFNGNSREVWFVFRGNLFQISTYAEQDRLLKGLFSTWEFR